MIRKEILIALVILCLAVVLLTAVPVSSLGTYDPWLDYNDDGKIDLKDVYATHKAYGTTGTPYNKTALLELQSQIDELRASLQSLRSDFVVLNASHAELQAQVSVLNDSVTTLMLTLQTYNSILAEYRYLIDSLNATVTELQSNLGNLNSTVTDQQSQIDSMLNEIGALYTSIDTVNARIDALESDMAERGIAFNSTYNATQRSTTETVDYVDIASTSLEITLNHTSNLAILFSATAWIDENTQGYFVAARSMIDTAVASPGSIILVPYLTDSLGNPYAHRHDLQYDSVSYTFLASDVPAGTHTVKMQWRVSGGTGNIMQRTLTVIAFPA